jgi:hypothetical protein
MLRRRPIACAAALPAAAFIMLACGNPPADTGSGAKPGAVAVASSEPPQARGQNACALVNLKEIEQIAGTALGTLHDIEDTDQTTCELRDDATKQVVVYVKVLWKGGKEQARAEQAAMGMAKQALNTPDVDIAELTGSGSVRGLADEAFYSDVMPSWVLKGDVLVQVISPLWPHDKTVRTFQAVARSALPRL